MADQKEKIPIGRNEIGTTVANTALLPTIIVAILLTTFITTTTTITNTPLLPLLILGRKGRLGVLDGKIVVGKTTT